MSRDKMKCFALVLVMSLVLPVTVAVAQPACPGADNIHITPHSPGPADSILLVLGLPDATAAEWVLLDQGQDQIAYDLIIYWGGGFGSPPFGTQLGPLSAGDYELVISPQILDVPDACPDITIPLVVSGAPAASVGVPMFSLLGLLLLIGILGGFAWRHLRQA